jgi:hypothetical protein
MSVGVGVRVGFGVGVMVGVGIVVGVGVGVGLGVNDGVGLALTVIASTWAGWCRRVYPLLTARAVASAKTKATFQ